jgi:4-hydroxybutyrate dehydrogenase
MTLISYTLRIHFADGILEEALKSEMETDGNLRPLILSATANTDNEPTERILSGLPLKSSAIFFRDIPEVPTESAVEAIVRSYRETNRDCLIAMGGRQTIELAKVSRLAIDHVGGLRTRSGFQGAAQRSAMPLAYLYTVPDPLGLATAVSPHASVVLSDGDTSRFTSSSLIPTVTICDPSLVAAEERSALLSAAVDAIARCTEAYLSRGYHPPSAGLALDGLDRAVSNLHLIADNENDDARREILAACLNSSLAQQRGWGATQAIGNALCLASGRDLDMGALSRLILPEVVNRLNYVEPRKLANLRRVLQLTSGATLSEDIEQVFTNVLLPGRLSELGLDDDELKVAAHLAASDMALTYGAPLGGSDELLSVMRAIR